MPQAPSRPAHALARHTQRLASPIEKRAGCDHARAYAYTARATEQDLADGT